MFISKLEMLNFKCFPGNTTLKFESGINYFVGNNNCGKTTVFRAIEFLQNGRNKDDWVTRNSNDADVAVTITIEGEDLPELIDTNNLSKLTKYLKDNALTLRRSSEETQWTDSRGKEKTITIKNLAVLNPETDVFENPAGFDKALSSLFDAQFIFSDLNNEDYQDFGKTKIVGKLLTSVTASFQETAPWKKFQSAHEAAFGSQGLTKELTELQTSIEDIMKEQYGETGVEFNFNFPTIDSFLKSGEILLEDNGVKTSASDKGTGMQRALALSLIQVYAQIEESKENITSPIFFFLDEPETFLHPMAQDKLLLSLKKLAKKTQIFITTHSPYLLRHFENQTDDLKLFSRDNQKIDIKEGTKLNLFPFSPSWGEINYLAFQVVGPEFHNELFGFLQNREAKASTIKNTIKSFDDWLSNQAGVTLTDDDHMNMGADINNTIPWDKTMTAYIRNYIDHPGPNLNPDYSRLKPTTEEIRESIEFMLSLL